MTKSLERARVCVPIGARRADELLALVRRAAEDADMIEVRLDFLEAAELERALDILNALFEATPLPLLFTLRSEEEGGRCALDASARAKFWEGFARRLGEVKREAPVFADLELALLESRPELMRSAVFERCAVVCSFHDFEGVPADLAQIYERMKRTPARVLKVAARAGEITDCVEVFKLLERARAEGRELIAVAMGEAGMLTRVLGPSRGAFLTFGATGEAGATAPGQTSAAALRHLYRVHSIDEQTLVTGLVGSPVAHSFSPRMHNAAFKARGVNGVYLPLEVADVDAFMRRMVHPATRELRWNLRGFSVTAPHKTAVMHRLDWIEPAAREIGAVNTVVCEGAELRGYNTDAAASLVPLVERTSLRGASVAVIGAGGAARALLWSLREHGAQTTVYARDIERARATAESFGASVRALDVARFEGFDAVVNTTPLGTLGAKQDETPATAEQLRGARLAYDLVYNPAVTRFMREARDAGCETLGGLPMLVAQAADQFKLWTGEGAPLEVMSAAVSLQSSNR